MIEDLSKGGDTEDPVIKVGIERLYLKEINLRLPHVPNIFENPDFKQQELKIEPLIEINVKSQLVAANKFEVALHAIVNAKARNFSLFHLEVQQAGVFNISAQPNQIDYIIKNYCLNILHPYLSQVISNSVTQAGFPPIILQPPQLVKIAEEQINQNLSKVSLSEGVFN